MGEGRHRGGAKNWSTSAWVLSGAVVSLSVIQTLGVAGGINSLQHIPSLFGSITAGGDWVLPLLVAVLLSVGWATQGTLLFLMDADEYSSLSGIATGSAIVLVSVWNLVAAGNVGGIVPVVEAVGTALLGTGGTVGAGLISGGYVGDSSRRPSPKTATETDESEPRVDEKTVERVASVVPKAVDRARMHSTNGEAAGTDIDRVKITTLRDELAAAIARDEVTPTIASRYGESYEIVNLPTRFREFRLPSGDSIHVRNLKRTMRERVTDDAVSMTEVATMFERVDTQYEDMNQFIAQHETSFDDRLQEAQTTVENIATLCDRIEDPAGERVREFVLEGRHPTVDGVPSVQTRIDTARDRLHECAFDEALKTVESAREQSEKLLTATDFFVGLIGTMDTSSRGASIPNSIAASLLEELTPIFEETYGRSVSVSDGRVRLGPHQSDSDGSPADDQPEGETASGMQEAGESRGVPRIDPRDISDEILFVLRELETVVDGTTDRIEYQTGELPESVGRPAILVELVAFCRRQTDLVEDIRLQEDAPPGFLQVELADDTPETTLTALRDRFVSRYGDS